MSATLYGRKKGTKARTCLHSIDHVSRSLYRDVVNGKRLESECIVAHFDCGGSADAERMSFFADIEESHRLCPGCFQTPAVGVPVVYFVRMPTGAVKIGTTANLHRRVKALGGDLLAWQLGGREVEQTLHTVFRDDRIPTLGDEYFALSPELLNYLEAVAA